MSPRVISGAAKGRKLRSVPGESTRPITDRVKEALFDIIGADVGGSSWWDLFAGTGAVGIEALSRGATFVRFSERERAAIETIRWNLAHCRLEAGSEICRGDAFALLAGPPDRRFDYVYIAPPQYQGLWSRALQALDANPGWLSEDAWVITQIHPREVRSVALATLDEFDRRKYGSTLLVFYERKEAT